MDSTLILVYDTSNGDSYLADFMLNRGLLGTRGDMFVPLGRHASLPHAVGEARRLGHSPQRWMSQTNMVPLHLDAIVTPFDKQASPPAAPGRPWRRVEWSSLKPGDLILGLRTVFSASASIGFVTAKGVAWLKLSSIRWPFRDGSSHVEVLGHLGSECTTGEARRVADEVELRWKEQHSAA